MKIRGRSIRFSAIETRTQNNNEQKLIKEIEELKSSPTLSNLNSLIDDKKSTLQDIRNTKLKGNMIRSRTKRIDESVHPTKYVCALESIFFGDETIKEFVQMITE